MSEKSNYGELKFIVQSGGKKPDFSEITDPADPLNDIKISENSIEAA